MRETKYFNSKVYIFLAASAYMFSNLLGEEKLIVKGLSISNILTIVSFLPMSFLVTKKFITSTLIIFLTLLLSAGANIFRNEAFVIELMAKSVTIVALYYAIKNVSERDVYLCTLFPWLLSISISFFLIALGQSGERYILYSGNIPRFAALVIEPAGFAMGSLVVYTLYLLSSDYKKTPILLFYIPFLAAQSSAVIIKLMIDSQIILKKKIAISVMFLSSLVFSLLLFKYTRVGDSIATRIAIYMDTMGRVQTNFFGQGYKSAEIVGLPGIIKFPLEIGFLVFLVYLSLLAIILWRAKKKLVAFLVALIPMYTETYGAVILWAGFLLLLKKSLSSDPRNS